MYLTSIVFAFEKITKARWRAKQFRLNCQRYLALLSLVCIAPLSAAQFQTPAQIEQHLQKFEGEHAIVERAKVIKSLASQQKTELLDEWVNEQLSNTAKITQANPDHPNQIITLVSIANSAQATLLHWRVSQYANHLLAAFTSNQWQWDVYFSNNSAEQSMAFSRLLSDLSTMQLAQLQQSLIQIQQPQLLSNRDLLALVQAQPNAQLSKQLIQNKVDEFSYQHVQLLPSLYNEQQAVQLLSSVGEKTPLTSQSLLVMSQQYSHLVQAQDHLINQLTQKGNVELSWLAAAAISQSKNDTLHQRVHDIAHAQHEKGAISFVKTKLAQKEQY